MNRSTTKNIIMTNKIILITGVSSGFGRAFAEAALAAGYTVIGTVRNEDGRREFEAIEPKRAKVPDSGRYRFWCDQPIDF